MKMIMKMELLKKLDNSLNQIAHNKLRVGTLIRLINPITNDTLIIKNSKKFNYPKFYKVIITKPVAQQLNLKKEMPLIELIEVKKNKSFIAKKTKTHIEEKNIHSNAPVETVKIDNIGKNKKKVKSKAKVNFNIVIAEFYSKESAKLLKKRIIDEVPNFDRKKLIIKSKKMNKIRLLSGPYNSINLMKNDYIKLEKLGFEELDISLNE